MFGGSSCSASEPFASAMVIVNGVFAWIGVDSGASMHEANADEVIALAPSAPPTSAPHRWGRIPRACTSPTPMTAQHPAAPTWTGARSRIVSRRQRRGRQSGFHVIGDGGHDIVMGGFSDAAQQVGDDAIIRSRPRLEHVPMPDDEQIAAMARPGIIASVQPGFDAEWGGPSGTYAVRLGAAQPDQSPGRALSQCWRTVRRGNVIHDSGALG